LVNKEPMPSVMYDGMVVTLQIQRTFIWLESQQGLMATGYTYPEWYDIKGRTMQESCIMCFFLTWFVN
jgi:hypothetical protein